MSGELNGVAHVILTAGDFARSTAFWRDMIAYLGLNHVPGAGLLAEGETIGGASAFDDN